ncbi:PaeR7I family type II restriction endonuclease [Sulfobacillus sp. hq2]|uniref:PaeR7I family type II restriction endonuclease n=1 Tax=Sulfobacillus sp. hq2 TaxID=2039167 RepID=UPI001FA81AE2|nr:PaeR7I family type II restriction endonuclease [Sulfobacillus sp. hq2]
MGIFMPSREELRPRIQDAIRVFWSTRLSQQVKQREAGVQDQGTRGSVTGGKQMEGFIQLIRWLLLANGVKASEIFTSGKLELPGFYRPAKQWDLVVVRHHPSGVKRLVATIEVKSHVGSFSNNFNNRTEEAMGSSPYALTL